MLTAQMTTPTSETVLGIQTGKYREIILQVPSGNSGTVTIGRKGLTQTFVVSTTPLYLRGVAAEEIYVLGTNANDVLDIIAI